MVRLRTLSVGVSLWLTACDTPKCEPITACDARSDSCQQKALKLAACLRGSPEDSQVQVEVVDYDTFVEEQVRDATDTEPTQDEIDTRAGLALFELSVPLDPEADARRGLQWVAAFYDSDTDRVTVLDRGSRGGDESSQAILLVHEMTHALQGADGLIDAIYDPVVTYDELLAASALLEGEATLVEDHAVIEALGFKFKHSRYARALRAYRGRSQKEVLESEDVFVGIRSGVPYAYGATFLNPVHQKGGAAAVAATLEKRLEGTRELLGKTSSDQKVRSPVPSEEAAKLVASYHLGGFFFEAFLRRIDAEGPEVLPHVIDDVFSVQRLSNGKLRAAWRLRFDAEVSISAIKSVLARSKINYQVGSDAEDDLWLVRNEDDSALSEPSFSEAPAIDTGFSAGSESRRGLVRCTERARGADSIE